MMKTPEKKQVSENPTSSGEKLQLQKSEPKSEDINGAGAEYTDTTSPYAGMISKDLSKNSKVLSKRFREDENEQEMNGDIKMIPNNEIKPKRIYNKKFLEASLAGKEGAIKRDEDA